MHTDKGAQTATDSNGNMYEVYRDHFKWDVGMTVRDFRSTCRIANIDVNELSGDNAPDLIKLMIQAYHRVNRFAKTGKTESTDSFNFSSSNLNIFTPPFNFSSCYI